jgi:predicted nucleic acid-binding protein
VLLETYAVLTRLPPPHRLAPDAARALVEGNLGRWRTIALEARGYWRLVHTAPETNIAGGRSYDALVVACAVRARVRAVLTFNERDFADLVPAGLRLEVPGR